MTERGLRIYRFALLASFVVIIAFLITWRQRADSPSAPSPVVTETAASTQSPRVLMAGETVDLWTYRARDLVAVDGDTVAGEADQGFSGRQEETLRLADVRAPERGQVCYAEAKQVVVDWLARVAASGKEWPYLVRTQPNTAAEPSERRTFTRYVADVHELTGYQRTVDRHTLAVIGASLNDAVSEWLAAHPECPQGE